MISPFVLLNLYTGQLGLVMLAGFVGRNDCKMREWKCRHVKKIGRNVDKIGWLENAV